MGRVCEICGKRPHAGNKISHSHRKTRRVWKPNIQKLLVEIDGKRKRMYVCTQCLKSGKVKRPSQKQESL
ncbi:MAG: 50S ribosomal protein L28 [Candidatus Omnitrophota bacterium]|nr:MAG: 50S ribosomal protein L28 [Candidatus Omnitrophota bacterium]HDN97951.1 50S ribosomal protein L28 [bacterium]